MPVHDSSSVPSVSGNPSPARTRPIHLVRYFEEIGWALTRVSTVEGRRCWRLAPRALSDLFYLFDSATAMLAWWQRRMKKVLSDERVRTDVAGWLSSVSTGMLDVLDGWALAGLYQPAGQMSTAFIDDRVPRWLVHAVRTADVWSAGSFADKARYPFRLERGAMRAMQPAFLDHHAPNGYMSCHYPSLAAHLGRQVSQEAARRLDALPAADGTTHARKRL